MPTNHRSLIVGLVAIVVNLALGPHAQVSATLQERSAATPASAQPPASAGHSLVYADDRQMVLLVNAGLGGVTKPEASTRTHIWGWTGRDWRLLDAAGPPVRNLAGVAYDSKRHALVMHGGTYDLGASFSDTWEWAGGRWRRFVGDGPGVRDHAQMVFDAARGKCVLFGGSGSDPETAFGDTWEFDGARWTQVATIGPPARIHHAMAYDPLLRRVVLFGGLTPGGPALGDTWSWDGTAWTKRGVSIAPRTHARMAFNGGLATLMLAGRVSGTGPSVLVRSNETWTPLTLTPEPEARYLTDMAFDAKRKVLVLFGGGAPRSTSLFADTWEFDGAIWRRIRER